MILGVTAFIIIRVVPREKEVLSVAEFNNTISHDCGLHTKNYRAGDIITIRDQVYDVEVFEIPEINIITTDYWEQFYSDFTNNTLLFTRITFSDNETLVFSGNQTEKFIVGSIKMFEVPIKRYYFVPINIIKGDFVDLAECHYNKFYFELFKTIKWYATFVQYNCTLEIEELNDNVCLINITSFESKPIQASPTISDITISFWEDGIKKDELIGDEIECKSKEYIDYLRREGLLTNDINKKVQYINFTFEGYDYWAGDKINISFSNPGVQNYELKIQLRYKYPVPGCENGRVIGSIQWEM